MDIYKKIWRALKKTDAIKIVINYIVICFIAALVLKFVDPNIKTYGEGLWYCFVASYTIGFGDIVVTTAIGKIITFIVVVHGMFVFAIMTGLIITYYNDFVNYRKYHKVEAFLDELESLPDLSKEELIKVKEKAEVLKNRIYEKSEASMKKYE